MPILKNHNLNKKKIISCKIFCAVAPADRAGVKKSIGVCVAGLSIEVFYSSDERFLEVVTNLILYNFISLFFSEFLLSQASETEAPLNALADRETVRR
jgi:hypothetical protein